MTAPTGRASTGTAPFGPPPKGATRDQIQAHIDAQLADLSLSEKVYMMSGHGFFKLYMAGGKIWAKDPYQAGGGCERLGIPAFYFTDGPRGVARGNSTCFPVTMARGASFDPDLERRIGEVMGIEARAQGCNLSGAVCVNLLRHPAWGRAQETYSEDPFHVGEMGTALAQGIQSHNVAATVKHFALNSIENARFKIDVQIDERTLHEVYLPHFKRIIEDGIATVMSAYNKMNGVYCGQNRHLLTQILREDWGFEGVVHSDWIKGVYDPYGAAAGLDIENPEPLVFGDKLVAAVEAGHIEPTVIDNACRRILSTIYRFCVLEDPLPSYDLAMVAQPAHVALAREAAVKSAVLLKNNGILPLAKSAITRLGVFGTLADRANLGDRGSSLVRPPYVITPLAGLRASLGDNVEIVTADESDLAQVKNLGSTCGAIIVIAGYTAEDEGEFIPGDLTLDGNGAPKGRRSVGGDRQHLGLGDAQIDLINVAIAANPNTIVVVQAGSAVTMEPWGDQAAAILQTFYAGMEGGAALADLIFGIISPSGRLPFTVPRVPAHLPPFDADADSITYGPLHGYTLADDIGIAPAFPFGFGLTYSPVSYRALTVDKSGDHLGVRVALRNDGDYPVDEVAQIYYAPPGRVAKRPRKLLCGFQRVSLKPGQTRIVYATIPLTRFMWWNPIRRGFELEIGRHHILVGGSSSDADLISAAIDL
jgi:beta-glucosidase